LGATKLSIKISLTSPDGRVDGMLTQRREFIPRSVSCRSLSGHSVWFFNYVDNKDLITDEEVTLSCESVWLNEPHLW